MKVDISVKNHRKGKDFHYEYKISDRILFGFVAVCLGSMTLMTLSKNWKSKKR